MHTDTTHDRYSIAMEVTKTLVQLTLVVVFSVTYGLFFFMSDWHPTTFTGDAIDVACQYVLYIGVLMILFFPVQLLTLFFYYVGHFFMLISGSMDARPGIRVGMAEGFYSVTSAVAEHLPEMTEQQIEDERIAELTARGVREGMRAHEWDKLINKDGYNW